MRQGVAARTSTRPARSTASPFVIVGAGAAGLQLAYFLQRSGHPYVVLESEDEVGSFWRLYPRSRQLISFNRLHSIYDDPELELRWDWNSLLTAGYEMLFRDYSRRLYPRAEEMERYLRDFASRYQLNVRFHAKVARISRDADLSFRLELEDGSAYRCPILVMATGLSTPNIPPIPGIEHVQGYETVPMDPAGFEGQRVLIIGKGNSAFEVADAILDTAAIVHLASPRPIRFAWNTRHPGDLRAHSTRILDTYQLKLLNGLLDAHVIKIVPENGKFLVSVAYVHADGEQETFCYDRVVRCTGFRYDDSPFDADIRPLDSTGRLPAMTSSWESTSVPNLFFAGTLMQAQDFRRASSAFIDGFRYNVRTLHAMLVARASGQPLAAAPISAEADALTEAVLARVSRSSGLWAQFGFLCDVLVVDNDGIAWHYQELPRDYVHDSALGGNEHYYTITLEWGSWSGDVFAIERHPAHEQAHTNVFLHPIVRRFRYGELIAVHHILEDLLGMYRGGGESGFVRNRSLRDMNRYHREEHAEPLRAFFASQLAHVALPAQRR